MSLTDKLLPGTYKFIYVSHKKLGSSIDRVPTVMDNPGKSRNLKPSWKVMDFYLFPRNHGKLIFQGNLSLLVCIYKFTTFFHALSCMYYNVCLVMIVVVRGGHLYFGHIL